MAFDRQGFIEDATAQGVSQEEINSYLKRQGAQPLAPSILTSNAVPNLGGILGGIIGRAGGPLVSTIGAGVGQGAASGMQTSARNMYAAATNDPTLQREPGVDAANFFNGTAGAVKTAASFNALLALLTPLKSLGQFKEWSNRNTQIDSNKLKTGMPDFLNKNKQYQMASPETQISTRSTMEKFIRDLLPLESTGGTLNQPKSIESAPSLGINEIYNKLKAFEGVNKPYQGANDMPSAVAGQSANLTARAAREFLNAEGGNLNRILNNTLSAGYKLRDNPFMKRLAQIAGAAMIYKALPN
jgi:hypothetical protein